ncbi:MAG TPA: tetratricopeptide repeat protein, partial [Anaerolineae bacterium]|nr:tetratricopeptide repeat protein [Anaerolineae bacterium]
KAAGRGVATAAAFKMLGDTLYLQHRLQESEVAYRRAIDFDQTDTDAQLGLGRALGGMGRLSDAADSLAKALDLNPASRIAWLAWVKVHHRLGDRRETVSGLDRLLVLGGLGCQENLTLAAISISLEAYDRATAFLETYLQEKPEGVGALADLATCYVKMGRYAAALEGYRAVLHSDPENANVRRNLRALQRRLVRETAVQ